MTTGIDRDLLARQIRDQFGTDRDPDRWPATVVLNVLVPNELPRELRMSPSEHEKALVHFLARCDLVNLSRMLAVEPQYVRAFAIYAFEQGGTGRLKAIAAGEGNRDERLVQRALDAYGLAALAGDHLDSKLTAGLPVHLEVDGEDRSAWTQVAAAARMLPELAGTLDRLLRDRRES